MHSCTIFVSVATVNSTNLLSNHARLLAYSGIAANPERSPSGMTSRAGLRKEAFNTTPEASNPAAHTCSSFLACRGCRCNLLAVDSCPCAVPSSLAQKHLNWGMTRLQWQRCGRRYKAKCVMAQTIQSGLALQTCHIYHPTHRPHSKPCPIGVLPST